MQASIAISEKLSEGIEHPETLIDYFNAILKNHGHPEIHVPQSVINNSKNIYQGTKQSIQSTNNFGINQSFHSSNIFQHSPTSQPTTQPPL